MRTRSHSSQCAAVRRWERAGTALATALKLYLDSCSYLETTYLKDSGSSKDLVTRIDSSLDSLHISLGQQLAQSRSTLARTRNRVTSPLYVFPDEVLSEIFLDVVYVPTKHEQDVYPGRPIDMTKALKMIYDRLHNLIGVCSVWRNVAKSCGALWSMVPMIDSGMKLGPPQRLTTGLSLQRAENRLHLAAIVKYRLLDLEILKGYAHRICTVNVKSESALGIITLLATLLHDCDLTSLSELSLFQSPEKPPQSNRDDSAVPRSYHYIFNQLHSLVTLQQLSVLLKSLSVLRVSGALFHWEHLSFSTRLVELRLQSVTLGYDSALVNFLRAVSSARGLRDLWIGSVISFPELASVVSPPFFSLPELRLLSLEDLDFNVLGLIFKSISPGPYELRIELSPNCTVIHLSDGTKDSVEYEELHELLRPVRIDTLMLQGGAWDWLGEPWISPTELRGLLSSMPQLKVLMLNDWEFNKDDWGALIRPSQEDTLPFPSLTELCLTSSKFKNTEGIKKVVKSHPLQKLLIGASVPSKDPDFDDPLFHETHKKIVGWLKTAVPNVCLADLDFVPMEFREYVWRLW